MKIKSEILLGMGLGLGHLTSLRVIKPIGISEILILLSFIALMLRVYKVKKKSNRLSALLKGYLKIVFFVQLPLITCIVYYSSELPSEPIYTLAFLVGFLLFLAVVENLKLGYLNLTSITNIFYFTFFITNIVTVLMFPEFQNYYRFQGFSNNPNQLMFYASSLSFLLVLNKVNLWHIKIISVILITIPSKSDAYNVVLLLSSCLFFYYKAIFNNRLSFKLKMAIFTAVSSLILIGSYLFFFVELRQLWLEADNGNTRIPIFKHGFNAALASPFIGWGAGSFSGKNGSFEGWEAHSTFIDLATQLGFIIPIIIYLISFLYVIQQLKRKEFLVASFATAYISAGLFHYNARHFFFWFEFAIFYFYVIENGIYFKKHASKSQEIMVSV